VHIISSVLNGERYLPDFIASLVKQTHTDWMLWIRDDGSTDTSAAILRDAQAKDRRVQLMESGGPRLGLAATYGWVLERIPSDTAYVMCGDVDDVWLPNKIERTLPAMLNAERAAPMGTPILVHSDLTVVDAELRVRAPSFWEMSGFDPDSATLRRLVVRNVVTSPGIMMNGALRRAIGRTPPEALYQDWWYALVAAALGRIVALRESTVLYRQHESNLVGASADPTRSLRAMPAALLRGLRNGGNYRMGLYRTATQARALLEKYEASLGASDREFLRKYSAIPQQTFLRRKLDVLRFRAPQEEGALRMVGAVLRG
jgi:glycosyltransferase involved in cell wall biosynthesis